MHFFWQTQVFAIITPFHWCHQDPFPIKNQHQMKENLGAITLIFGGSIQQKNNKADARQGLAWHQDSYYSFSLFSIISASPGQIQGSIHIQANHPAVTSRQLLAFKGKSRWFSSAPQVTCEKPGAERVPYVENLVRQSLLKATLFSLPPLVMYTQ